MEWLMRLEEAVSYIEDHLETEISQDEAAKIACCSTFYFRRMFSYVAGISLSEYVRRRRMTQAAFELQQAGTKVIDVAVKYGYTSPTAFNRAFQGVHGVSPTAAKKQGAAINAYPPIRFSVQVTGGEPMLYRILEKAPMRVVGVRVPLTEYMDENQRIAPSFWKELLGQDDKFRAICELSNTAPEGVLGITTYQGPGEIYYYIAAATDKPIPKGMLAYQIPASTWVVFESEGRFQESVQVVFKRFITEWLPFSGYVHAQLPDIEVYPIVSGAQRSGRSEVWIAVKKEKEKPTNE